MAWQVVVLVVALAALGWRTDRWARRNGFTHKGWLHCLLPVYAVDLESEAPGVAFRWAPLDACPWIDDFLSHLWMLACDASGNEPNFGIYVTGHVQEES